MLRGLYKVLLISLCWGGVSPIGNLLEAKSVKVSVARTKASQLTMSKEVTKVRDLASTITSKEWQKAGVILRELERNLTKRLPMTVVEAVPLIGPPQGLGVYTPLLGGRVRGDELYLYIQLRYHETEFMAGYYRLHITSDLYILDHTGVEIARDIGFGESRFSAKVDQRDTFVVLALRTKGLPIGKYSAKIYLHDKVGNKSATVVIPFSI